MSYLLAFLFSTLTTITMTPKSERVPTLVHNKDSSYTARNPRRHPVDLEINCGPDYDLKHHTVPAVSSEYFNLQSPTGEDLECWLSDWHDR